MYVVRQKPTMKDMISVQVLEYTNLEGELLVHRFGMILSLQQPLSGDSDYRHTLAQYLRLLRSEENI